MDPERHPPDRPYKKIRIPKKTHDNAFDPKKNRRVKKKVGLAIDLDERNEPIETEEKKRDKNLERLQKYVQKMAYHPVPPPPRKKRQEIYDPSKRILLDTYAQYKQVLVPKQRGHRLRRNIAQFTAISTEQLEQIIRNQKAKEKRKEDLLKRKQELYYEMLTKLEHQCRTQYLNVLLKKFANFIAKLATKMRIPPQLIEPYARMQRGIFCNILLAIGVQPTNQSSIYYTSQEALKYEVCHKLAHALLSLIIKALDSAATKDPEEDVPSDGDFEMDNYIKDRLMCAAEKKIINERVQNRAPPTIQSPVSSAKKCKFYLHADY